MQRLSVLVQQIRMRLVIMTCIGVKVKVCKVIVLLSGIGGGDNGGKEGRVLMADVSDKRIQVVNSWRGEIVDSECKQAIRNVGLEENQKGHHQDAHCLAPEGPAE